MIKDNLNNSFCDVYAEDDRNQIVDKYYSVMFRYIKETIMMLSFDQKVLKSKSIIMNKIVGKDISTIK